MMFKSIFIFMALIILQFSCRNDDDCDHSKTVSNDPYLIEAPIFVLENHGFSPDTTSGCGMLVNIYDSTFEMTIGYFHVDNVPNGVVPDFWVSYTGIIKVYPERKHVCEQTWLEPSHTLTLSKCDILYMELSQ